MNDKQVNYSHRLAQTKQQVGKCVVRAFLMTNESRAYTNSQDSPWPKLGGSHHLPPYNILKGLHPIVILFQDSQFEILGMGIFATLEAHKFLYRLLIEVRSKAKL
jgi:hypothetical protein